MESELPRGTHREETEEDRELNTERLYNLSELIADASTLVSALMSNKIPDYSSRTFSYWFPGSGPVSLPQLVQDRTITREVSEIYLYLDSELGQPSDLRLDIVDSDSTLHISRSGTGENKSEPDWLIDRAGKATPTTKISKKEVNWLITSLIRPNKTGDYSQFTDTNFLDLALFEDLADTLELTASSISGTGTYLLQDGANRLDFTQEQKELLTFSITYEAAKPGRTIVAHVDCQYGVDVSFYTIEYGERTKLVPDLGDLIHLREILQQEIQASNPVHVAIGHTEETADENEPVAWNIPVGTNMNLPRFSDEEAKSDLDEDGFDSPNPRTA